MATKGTDKTTDKNEKPATVGADVAQSDPFSDLYNSLGDAPDDFENESAVEVDGWWKAEKGLGFCGQIVGAFKISKQTKQGTNSRNIVLVKLSRPTKAVSDKLPVRLEAGQVLGVSINHTLLPMLNYIEHRGWVWAKMTGEKEVGQPQPMKVYDLRLKGEKSAPPALNEAGASDIDGDDIPF